MNTKPKQFTLFFDGQDGGRYIRPLSEHNKNHEDDKFIDVIEKCDYDKLIKLTKKLVNSNMIGRCMEYELIEEIKIFLNTEGLNK